MTHIQTLKARQILDSRGNPTIETEVYTTSGSIGRASVPSGASTGQREAVEKRDQDPAYYAGQSVMQAIDLIHRDLAPALYGLDSTEQAILDQRLCDCDGTPDKSRVGANAILSVSLAVARAAAQCQNKPLYAYIAALHKPKQLSLPVPMMNILNGGAHANNKLSMQEFMIIPQARPFSMALHQGVIVFKQLKRLLETHQLATTVGDEGGFAPMIDRHDEALTWITRAITDAGLTPGQDIQIALDSASSEFYQNQTYTFETGEQFTPDALIAYYADLAARFPIVSLEDGLDESDWDGWRRLTTALGDTLQLVGDDLFVTNAAYLQRGIHAGVGNAILIKPNQIGTLSETLKTITLAQANGYKTIISHRSGETEDVFIADLAVGTGAGQIKTGSLSRTDRVAKYNQLLRIEAALDTPAYG